MLFLKAGAPADQIHTIRLARGLARDRRQVILKIIRQEADSRIVVGRKLTKRQCPL